MKHQEYDIERHGWMIVLMNFSLKIEKNCLTLIFLKKSKQYLICAADILKRVLTKFFFLLIELENV